MERCDLLNRSASAEMSRKEFLEFFEKGGKQADE
jgi:hypothetical protein